MALFQVYEVAKDKQNEENAPNIGKSDCEMVAKETRLEA